MPVSYGHVKNITIMTEKLMGLHVGTLHVNYNYLVRVKKIECVEREDDKWDCLISFLEK